MTAEAVVMNKVAVALAADSAVTVSESKVFNTATKIFSLSHTEPVGAMIYGQGELLGMPWETLVKLFRDDLGASAYPSLEHYAEALLDFLRACTQLFPDEVQADYAERKSRYFLDLLVERIRNAVDDALNARASAGDEVDEESIVAAVREETAAAVELYEQLFDSLPAVAPQADDQVNDIRTLYGEGLRRLVDSVFSDSGIADALLARIQELCVQAIRQPFVPNCPDTWSGVVVAGFGEADLFPKLQALRIWGVAAGHLLHSPISEEERICIGFDNPAALQPFAQGEMIHTFMEGVDPDYQEYMEREVAATLAGFAQGVAELLSDCLGTNAEDVATAMEERAATELTGLVTRLNDHRERSHVMPVIDVVSVLPKNELAELAESLVSLTSLKRKVTNVQETVGGPIDVAVISKKDGLVWIKRKHYFSAELNPHFMARYEGGSSHDS